MKNKIFNIGNKVLIYKKVNIPIDMFTLLWSALWDHLYSKISSKNPYCVMHSSILEMAHFINPMFLFMES